MPIEFCHTKDVERIIGCTGVPADSHDVIWFNLHKDKQGRCKECGSGEFRFEESHFVY